MTENNGTFAWKIKDENGADHVIKYVKRSAKDRSVYFDGEIIYRVPNDLKHYEFFNYEITFDVIGKRCRIESLLSQNLFKREPKLIVDGINARSRLAEPDRTIPKMPIYGFVFIILSTLLVFATLVCATLFPNGFMPYVYSFGSLVPLWLTIYSANMPLNVSFSRVKTGFIRLFSVICLFIVSLSLLGMIVL